MICHSSLFHLPTEQQKENSARKKWKGQKWANGPKRFNENERKIVDNNT